MSITSTRAATIQNDGPDMQPSQLPHHVFTTSSDSRAHILSHTHVHDRTHYHGSGKKVRYNRVALIISIHDRTAHFTTQK